MTNTVVTTAINGKALQAIILETKGSKRLTSKHFESHGMNSAHRKTWDDLVIRLLEKSYDVGRQEAKVRGDMEAYKAVDRRDMYAVIKELLATFGDVNGAPLDPDAGFGEFCSTKAVVAKPEYSAHLQTLRECKADAKYAWENGEKYKYAGVEYEGDALHQLYVTLDAECSKLGKDLAHSWKSPTMETDSAYSVAILNMLYTRINENYMRTAEENRAIQQAKKEESKKKAKARKEAKKARENQQKQQEANK